jgi:hypothetical protein
MTISVRMRRDVVVADPQRFLAAARRAYRDLHPEVDEAEAAGLIVDAVDAAYALLERFGHLEPDDPRAAARRAPTVHHTPEHTGRAPVDGPPDPRRPDGLSAAGWRTQIVLNDPMPLRDPGCFDQADPFALPSDSSPHG